MTNYFRQLISAIRDGFRSERGLLGVKDVTVTDIGARAFNSAAISIANDIDTALTFDSERWDTDNIHSTVSNTGRLTAQTAGKYVIAAVAQFAGSGTGDRRIFVRLNGVTNVGGGTGVASASGTFLSTAIIYNLAVGDYVECMVFQNSGGALNINSNAQYTPEFMMQKIAP